jgi:hypothetical protein
MCFGSSRQVTDRSTAAFNLIRLPKLLAEAGLTQHTCLHEGPLMSRDGVQLNEMWTFLGCKQKNIHPEARFTLRVPIGLRRRSLPESPSGFSESK